MNSSGSQSSNAVETWRMYMFALAFWFDSDHLHGALVQLADFTG